MTEIKKITCDCGCGRIATPDEAHTWFHLDRPKPGDSEQPEIQDPLLFATFECLVKWVLSAVNKKPEIKKNGTIILAPAPAYFRIHVKELETTTES